MFVSFDVLNEVNSQITVLIPSALHFSSTLSPITATELLGTVNEDASQTNFDRTSETLKLIISYPKVCYSASNMRTRLK